MGGGVREVYLDYNASAPLDPRVFEAMAPVLSNDSEVLDMLDREAGHG